MSEKTCETRVHIVNTPLNLPIFLSGRTRFRNDYLRQVPTYITKKKKFFTKHCSETKETETREEKDLKHLVGIYPSAPERCTNFRPTKISRDLSEDKPWRLGPGTYGIPKEPFGSKGGSLGSYWCKKPRKAKRMTGYAQQKKGKWQYYNLPSCISSALAPINKHKGVFLTNARDRKPTARCMVSNPVSAYRNPDDPSPAHYYPEVYKFGYGLSRKIYTDPPNPHIFIPHTSVPDKCLPLIRRHISFEPAVGRYEIRVLKHCPCAKKIITVALHMMIDREKRYKFRRLPYKKIKLHKHCYPDWDHVPGKGHRHLFRTPTGKSVKKNRPQGKEMNADKVAKTLSLYPDSKYINMINAPRRGPISTRTSGIKRIKRGTQIRFNCIFRRVIRRSLRINKKIVFNSGSERFPELDYRPVVMTTKQLEDLKNTLPPERQLRDHPVMHRTKSQIRSQLHETPLHMRPAYEPTLRKRLFKFLPLPGPKVLIAEKDLRPGSMADVPLFYNKPLNPQVFMKGYRPVEVVKLKVAEEIGGEAAKVDATEAVSEA